MGCTTYVIQYSFEHIFIFVLQTKQPHLHFSFCLKVLPDITADLWKKQFSTSQIQLASTIPPAWAWQAAPLVVFGRTTAWRLSICKQKLCFQNNAINMGNFLRNICQLHMNSGCLNTGQVGAYCTIQLLSMKFRDWFNISAQVNVRHFREKCSKGAFFYRLSLGT
jgi:hypothetical protein